MNLLGDLNEDTLQNATFQKNCIISKHSNSIQLANAKSTIQPFTPRKTNAKAKKIKEQLEENKEKNSMIKEIFCFHVRFRSV